MTAPTLPPATTPPPFRIVAESGCPQGCGCRGKS